MQRYHGTHRWRSKNFISHGKHSLVHETAAVHKVYISLSLSLRFRWKTPEVAEVRFELHQKSYWLFIRRQDDLTFQIAMAYPRGGDAIVLRAMSVRDCQLWMQVIDEASRRCREAEKACHKSSWGRYRGSGCRPLINIPLASDTLKLQHGPIIIHYRFTSSSGRMFQCSRTKFSISWPEPIPGQYPCLC